MLKNDNKHITHHAMFIIFIFIKNVTSRVNQKIKRKPTLFKFVISYYYLRLLMINDVYTYVRVVYVYKYTSTSIYYVVNIS